MSNVQWKKGLCLPQDPEAVTDYGFSWATFLGTDTIVNVAIDSEFCLAEVRNHTSSEATFRVSEVADGARVTLTVTTATGQVDERTIFFYPDET